MAAVATFRAIFGSKKDEDVVPDHCSTTELAYEDQRSPASTGYQPKVETDARASSLPPASSSDTSCKYQDMSRPIGVPLGIPAVHLGGQEGTSLGKARKRTSSAFPENRPPRVPRPVPILAPLVAPQTPELAGTNVSFPGSASTGQDHQSPMDTDHGPVFHDMYTPPKQTGNNAYVAEGDRGTVSALPFGLTECSGGPTDADQQEGGAVGVPPPKNGDVGSSSSLSASVSATTQQTPARQLNGGDQDEERNPSKTPPRLQRDPTPPAEKGSSSCGRPSLQSRVVGNDHPQRSRGSSRISAPEERGRNRQPVTGQFDMTRQYEVPMSHRGPLHSSRGAGSVRSQGSGRSLGSQSVGHISNRLGLQCWNKQDTCSEQAEHTCGGHQGLVNEAGQRVPCNRPTCRHCATDCDMTGCQARFLCSECAPTSNHRCGYVAMMIMQEEIQARNEANLQKKLREQDAMYQVRLNEVISNANQTQSQAHAAITSIKAELDNTAAAEEETKKAALRYVEEQNRIATEGVARQAQEQQAKMAEYERSANEWAAKREKELAEKEANAAEYARRAEQEAAEARQRALEAERVANESVQAAQQMIVQAREYAEKQANEAANRARQEILQQTAEVQAMAEGQAQGIREAATSTISSLREKEQAIMAYAESKYREQEQEISGMRKEMENMKGKNAQLETKLEKTLTGQADLVTRAQEDKDQEPGEQRGDNDQTTPMGPFSRVATAVTNTVNNVFGTKKSTPRSSSCPLLTQCSLCQKKATKLCTRCTANCCANHFVADRLCSACHDKLPDRGGYQGEPDDMKGQDPEDVGINGGMNEKLFPTKGMDTTRTPINVKPLPFPPTHRPLQTEIVKDPLVESSVVGLLSPSTGLVHHSANLGSKLQAQPLGQNHNGRELNGLSRDEERRRDEWEYARDQRAQQREKERELEEFYEATLANLKEKEKHLNDTIAKAQQDHGATIAREVASALAAAGVGVLPEKGKTDKKSKKEEDRRCQAQSRQKGVRTQHNVALASVPEGYVASTGSQPGKQMIYTGQGQTTEGKPSGSEERRGDDRKGNPRRLAKKRPPAPPGDDPDDSPDDDDEDSDEEDDDEWEEIGEDGAEEKGGNEKNKSKKKRKGEQQAKVPKWEAKTFVNFPNIPDVRSYGEWRSSVTRIMGGICNRPDEALIWIKQAFDGQYPIEELRKKQASEWSCLDVNLSIALSEKLAIVKNDPNATPWHRQLVCEIQVEEDLAVQGSRILMGREIIRHVGKWAAVKAEHGQKHNISDLLRLRIKEPEPDKDIYEFYFRWKEIYNALYGTKRPEDSILEAIHDAFYRQIKLCTGPPVRAVINKYEFDVAQSGDAYDRYQWLVKSVLDMLLRERRDHNDMVWDGANHDRDNQPRGVGGPGILNMPVVNQWKPGDAMGTASDGTLRVRQYATVCSKAKAGKRCTDLNCMYDHPQVGQQPTAFHAPPQQPDQTAAIALQKAQQAMAEVTKYKQMLVTSQNRNAQHLQAQAMQANTFDAAPAPMPPLPQSPWDPWQQGAIAAGLAAGGNNAVRQGRDATPGPGARDRAASLASASPGGGDKSTPGGPCYAASRGVCAGALKNPPCTRCKGPGPQPPLSELDELKRDRWEGGMDKLGKQVPYLRTDEQIKAALINVEANKHLYNAPKGEKGGGKGKKGPMVCHYCHGEGHKIADCPMYLNGDPKGWGPPKKERKGKGPGPQAGEPGRLGAGRGGPRGYGQPGSVDKPCGNFKKGKCLYGEECVFQHTE